jgi:hypothetical protein
MRHTAKAIALALLVLASPAGAQQGPSLQGSWLFTAEGSDDVSRAIEQAVAPLNFVVRPIASGRLRKTNSPYQAIRISYTPTQVTLVADAHAPIVTPATPTVVKWRREDGEVFDVSTQWFGGSLEQTFAAPDGKRVNLYTPGPDGNTLALHVTVTSPRLTRPVSYTLRYHRE